MHPKLAERPIMPNRGGSRVIGASECRVLARRGSREQVRTPKAMGGRQSGTGGLYSALRCCCHRRVNTPVSPSHRAPRSSQRSDWTAYVALGLACLAGAATFATYNFPCPWDPREETLAGPLIYGALPVIPACTALVLGGKGKVRTGRTESRSWPAFAARFIAGAALLMALYSVAVVLLFATAMRGFSNFGD